MKKKGKVTTKGLSMRKQKFNERVENLPTIEGINQNQMLMIDEAFINYKLVLPRYQEVKNDPKAFARFCVNQRNPLWDITKYKYFSTGLMSDKAKKCESCERSKDHFIQRVKALRFIFRELEKYPDMDLITFIALIKRHGSTVFLTKEEHRKVSTYARKNKDNRKLTNVKIYKRLKIKVRGLGEWCKNNHLTKVVEKSF